MDGSPGDTYCETCWASFLEQNKQLEGVWQEDGTPYDLAGVDPFAADCNATHGKGVNPHEIVRRAILLPDPFQLLVLFQEAGPACLAIDIPGGSIIRVSCCPAAGASTDIPQREDVQPGVSGPKPPRCSRQHAASGAGLPWSPQSSKSRTASVRCSAR